MSTLSCTHLKGKYFELQLRSKEDFDNKVLGGTSGDNENFELHLWDKENLELHLKLRIMSYIWGVKRIWSYIWEVKSLLLVKLLQYLAYRSYVKYWLLDISIVQLYTSLLLLSVQNVLLNPFKQTFIIETCKTMW